MSKNKTIWIINQYASTPETGMGGRHYYLAQELARQGHTINVIAGSYSHLLKNPVNINTDFQYENIDKNFNFIWVKLPEYKHAHSKKRILNEFLFSKKITKLTGINSTQPDVIIHSSPSLISYFGAIYLAKKLKSIYVFEVRDIWPLTLINLGGYSRNHPFIKLLQWIEDQAYQKAKYVFSNLPNAFEHMQFRGMSSDKFTWIPNGVSLSELGNKKPLSQHILKQIPSNKFIVGYTGTLGEANAMQYLLDAAAILNDQPDIHFILVGSGRQKLELITQAEALKLNNISFLDSIEKTQVQSMLEQFDACYIGWHKKDLYRFGIAANKIPEYMYSAKPVIHSFSGKGDFIQQANSGITVEAENPKAIAEAILELKNLPLKERNLMGQRGKEFVLNNLTYEKLATKLITTLFEDAESNA